MKATTSPVQIRVAPRSPAYWRVTIDNPPINVMGPAMLGQFHEIINALETDEHVKVVVFDSAVDGYFLNHSDFLARLEDLIAMPPGPTGLSQWPDFLVRLTRARRLHRPHPRAGDRQWQRDHARLRHEFRQSRENHHLAMGGGRGNGRRRRLHGPVAPAHRP
jgi:enoyl-CoA hydratase/carnithine racemase